MSHKINEARDNLLAEAKKLLIENGYNQFNIRTLVKNCNISIGTFYNNFNSKEDLVITILNNDWKEILNTIDDIGSTQLCFRKKLEAIYSSVHVFFHSYKNIFIEILMADNLGKGSNLETKKSFCDRMSVLINSEIDTGSIRAKLPPDKLSYIILQNFIYMSKEEYITFEDFYDCLNIHS